MTTNANDPLVDLDRAVETANQILRRRIDELEAAKTSQPDRLAKARSDAEEERGWALIEEPWETLITAIPAHNSAGERTGTAITLPSITAKELFGARLAFDMLDAGDDDDRLEAVKTRYFTELNGDTGLLFLVFAAALDTVASLIVPQLLSEIEQSGSNYTERVRLSEACAKAWSGRVSELRGPQDDASDCGVRPVDSFDIGAAALDPEDPR
jgi:hypothetical protein